MFKYKTQKNSFFNKLGQRYIIPSLFYSLTILIKYPYLKKNKFRTSISRRITLKRI